MYGKYKGNEIGEIKRGIQKEKGRKNTKGREEA